MMSGPELPCRVCGALVSLDYGAVSHGALICADCLRRQLAEKTEEGK